MASAKIEDRKKFLGGPWDVIKGKNPVLSKGLFKPPLDPLVDKYDKDLSDYQALLTKKKTLKALFEQQDAAYTTASQASVLLLEQRLQGLLLREESLIIAQVLVILVHERIQRRFEQAFGKNRVFAFDDVPRAAQKLFAVFNFC